MAATSNLKIGDSVVVKSGAKDHDLDSDLEGWQGRIVNIRLGRGRYDHPLYQLRPIDKNDPNYQIIEDYTTWFAN